VRRKVALGEGLEEGVRSEGKEGRAMLSVGHVARAQPLEDARGDVSARKRPRLKRFLN
jgi:hypothetical protein